MLLFFTHRALALALSGASIFTALVALTSMYASARFADVSAAGPGRAQPFHLAAIRPPVRTSLQSLAGNTITVNSIANVTNGTDGLCTLREAIEAANANAASGPAAGECAAGSSNSDTITFTVVGTISLTSALPSIASDMSINGPGASQLTVRRSTAGGTPNFRIFTINPSVTALFSGLTISNGNAAGGSFPSDAGGGVLNDGGTVTLNDLVVSGNTATSPGGGVDNTGGTMMISDSTISNNHANSGAGVNNNGGGTLMINRSTISNNISTDQAGGLFNSGTAFVTNTTVSSNSAVRGGGIDNAGNLTLSSSTISLNNATSFAGGVSNPGIGVLNFTNTLIAGNSSPAGPDCGGASFNSQDYNLIGNTSGASIGGMTTHNVTNVDALLGSLTNNGGPTLTHSLLPGSPAIDAGNASPLLTDQRGMGFNRAADANGDGAATFDIGAYEVQTILVVNTNDSGPGSLRQAIIEANIGADTQAINFQAGLTGAIALSTPLPDLTTSMLINGPGANQLTVQRSTAAGTPDFRVFTIPQFGTASISRLTISNGKLPVNQAGGGVSNRGTLTMTECNVYGNNLSPVSFDAGGGGLFNAGMMTLINCNIGGPAPGQGNGASGGGAGILEYGTLVMTGGSIVGNAGTGINVAQGGTTLINVNISNNSVFGGAGGVNVGAGVTLINCLVSNNSAMVGGGGINVEGGGLNAINTTISGNTSGQGGGGIRQANNGVTHLVNVTIKDNRSDSNNTGGEPGGGIDNSFGTVTLANTIVAGNFRGGNPSKTADDINGAIAASSSFNLIGTGGSGGLTNGTNNNQVGVANPGLGILANNGGPTQTHALLPGSAAINAGSNALAVDQNNNSLTTDQRGVGFSRIVNATVDIGTFESRGFSISTTSGTPQSATITTVFDLPLMATVSSAFGEQVGGGQVTFTAPGSGASGTFTTGGAATTVPIAAGGVAMSPAFTANGLAGNYNISAGGNGISGSATFNFTNLKGSTTTSLSSSVNPSRFGQNVTLVAVVTSPVGMPTGTTQFKDNGTDIGPPQTLNASGQASISTSTLGLGVHTITADYNGDLNFSASAGSLSGGQVVGSIFQFNQSSYTVGEADPRVELTVTRSGDTSSASSVKFTTIDAAGLQNCNVFNGVASPRCDFIVQIGTVSFAAGETSKTFSVAIINDSYAEGTENFTVTISNPSGGTLGTQSNTTVMIVDNEGVTGPNPIDQTPFFVRQQYLDFLGREPDPPGEAAWISTIDNCPLNDTTCDRIHVSSIFFQSAEFQQRGNFVYRFYPVSYGRKPDYAEFIPDLASVSGFLSDEQLETAKLAFIAEFISRPAFVIAYNGLNNTQYVDTLLTTAGVTLASRQAMIDGLNAGTLTRAQVLRQIAESAEVGTKYFNQAYAVMEYFGYLRRQPDAFYLDWIAVLDGGGSPRTMAIGFVNSAEYRQRFGP